VRGTKVGHVRRTVGALLWIVAALVGCERTQVTPAAYLVNLKAAVTPVGIDVSFELLDRDRQPTLVLFGTGVIRIEDRPDSLMEPEGTVPETPGPTVHSSSPMPGSTASAAGGLDSTWLLYNARFFVYRDHFSREVKATQTGERTVPICHLGVYPYRHFLRKPRRPDGVVRVAFVAVDGSYVMMEEQRVRWPAEAFDEEVGKPVKRFGNR